ncbi:putative serine protein kinase [Stachybotrys elegans]|uniref:non-specific serine/threonine protein kinase n=1 Tax=Stachybotrys elegans TaxID=80388 RepID=A0A8K0SPS0_9HYPO|nr:putative serine protein kinase [Stachybotrys elegans]
MANDTSSPPTPQSSMPTEDQWRFEVITSPCEWAEAYCPGGYHPVHLGDTFKNDRYRVIRKLGDGSFSTVWLARDTQNGTYVALKILVADQSEAGTELQILRHITTVAPAQAGQYITQLLDEFEHKGPNGTHKCLIFEPMGPSVNSMVEELPQFNPRRRDMIVRYPPNMARAILKQSIQALELIHANGIAHGDFQPGNMLFCLSDIHKQPEDSLRQENDAQGMSTSPLQRLDGKTDKWAPRYLCISQPLTDFTPYADGLKIKLSDMGGAYFFGNPPEKFVTPVGLRAPELILTGDVNEKLDIWSFGCILFELITGRPLFCIPGLDGRDDNHLLALTAAIGPLPDELFKLWTTSSLYFTPKRELFNCQIGGIGTDGKPLMLKQFTMEELFDQAAPDIDEEEAVEIKQLIRRILTYDPVNRPTATEILSDPWFQKIDV